MFGKQNRLYIDNQMRVSKSSRFEKFEVIEKTLLTEMANQLDGYIL